MKINKNGIWFLRALCELGEGRHSNEEVMKTITEMQSCLINRIKYGLKYLYPKIRSLTKEEIREFRKYNSKKK